VIHFVRPEAFLLGPVVVLLLRRHLVGTWPVTVLRALALLLVLAILAEPYAGRAVLGRDLVLVLDRSRSVPESAARLVEEVAGRASREARSGDRIGEVAFGREPVVEHVPVEGFERMPEVRTLDRDGSDLARAIDAGLALIPPDRPGSLLLLSDGEATGGEAEAAARRAARRDVRIDVVPLRRTGQHDLAVEELSIPGEVGAGEPFQLSAWVRSDRPVEGSWRLERDGVVVAEGRRVFRTGLTRLGARDRIVVPGIHPYRLQVVLDAPDRVPENDVARAALRVDAPARVLVITPGGREDRLTKSLAAGGLAVDVSGAANAPLTLDRLDAYRAVILEDVPAEDLPDGGLEALASFVTDLGGGLLMTGGKASFGPGGYHLSAVGEVLPVSLELRQEQRKFAVAMAIALDRSGSMAMTVPGGGTKMDLANRGTCAAIELLTSLDSVAVIAVDSAPHLVVPMGPVKDKSRLFAAVRSIESMGGGIFTSTAIHAAAGELGRAPQATKHIVVFADAADAEEPGDLHHFVPQLVKGGVTVSVIGLGSASDSDSAFLQDVASWGRGRCTFVSDPADLPRVFAQETIQIARSALVEEPTALVVRPELRTVGALEGLPPPTIGGFNVAYLKPGADVGLLAEDEWSTPAFSFWQRGLGRSAAFLGVADGDLSGGLATWPRYGDFFTTVTRWLAGSDASGTIFAEARREGHEGVLAIEVEAGRELDLGRLSARVLDPQGVARPLVLRRTAATRLEVRVPLDASGIWRPVVEDGEGRVLRVAPWTLPYSPEFEPRAVGNEGDALLARIAAESGGRVDPAEGTLFDGPREGAALRSFTVPLAVVALIVVLLEILVRRTGFVPRWNRERLARWMPWLRRRGGARVDAGAATSPEGAPTRDVADALVRARAGTRTPPAAGAAPAPPALEKPPAGPPPAHVSPPAPGGISSVIDRAKKRRRPGP
jgi:uncharacterized membrane protein